MIRKSTSKTIGNYFIGKTVGEGAYARVKYGEHKDTGEAVALKIISKKRLKKAGLTDTTDAEVEILRRLTHKHIVAFKDVFVGNERTCIVMEYVDGGTLFDLVLKEGPLRQSIASRIMNQVVDALDHCHSQGIFHRDLKPANILLTRDSNVKLIDFGLSGVLLNQHYEDCRLFQNMCGSPDYTAPEILRGLPYEGAPADIWSLGVVLYVLLVGKRPFADRTFAKMFHKITAGQFEVPTSLTADAKDLLRRMLNPNPEERITLAEIRQHSWTTRMSGRTGVNLVEENIKKGISRKSFTSFTSCSEGEKISKKLKRNSIDVAGGISDSSCRKNTQFGRLSTEICNKSVTVQEPEEMQSIIPEAVLTAHK